MSAPGTPCACCAGTAGGRPQRARWCANTGAPTPGFTLAMVSLSSLGALFFAGGMVRRVVTTYSGDIFPTFTPNPIFQKAYASGAVEVEHWSILTYAQRLEAAARGLPAVVTGSIEGSSMASNDAYRCVDTDFGPVGLLAPLVPDVTLVHGAVADVHGNVAMSEPLLEGPWPAWAARRGVIATVEAVVDDLTGLGTRVKIPAHRVLAVVEAPFGAHPGGVYAPGLPARSYGEDIPFWSEARARPPGPTSRDWAKRWALEPATHEDYLGTTRSGAARASRGTHRPGVLAPRRRRPSRRCRPAGERLGVRRRRIGARELLSTVHAVGADAVLAGAGVANLAAWVAVDRARAAGSAVELTAELGMFGYHPTPADPYIFNHRVFPTTAMLADTSIVLGMVVGGPGTRTVACLGAAQVDRHGNLNSTTIPGGPFLVGSGGANDVASRADACVVVSLARPQRLVADVGYVTSPGRNVIAVVTDLGVLRRVDGVLRLAAVPSGPDPLAQRVQVLQAACGWDVEVNRQVEELAPVETDEVMALRWYDPERLFLS